MNRYTLNVLTAIAFTLALAAQAHAAKIAIGGDVEQSADVDNVYAISSGMKSTAANEMNAVRGSVSVGGGVRQTLKAHNVYSIATGVSATATNAINVVGN
ncbi:hypothetical protein [Thiocystis violacea]|uniref:hypothetical protein n=1 Tax=Thiocystis violacea TaxID=13725 RepID=UPI001903C194|nr:hypothetical protein [Thiocystis violacea]MBK1720093.1 hypothetical protein [Thiocystis violacea]